MMDDDCSAMSAASAALALLMRIVALNRGDGDSSRVVARGRPRRADRTVTGEMPTDLKSDPAGGGGVHGHLKLNKGNFKCVSARGFARFQKWDSQAPAPHSRG